MRLLGHTTKAPGGGQVATVTLLTGTFEKQRRWQDDNDSKGWAEH